MSLHAEAVAWANRVLYDEMPLFAASDDSFADSLVLVAEQYAVPVESLIAWLRYRVAGKEWSLAAWRAWCERYADAASQLPPEAVQSGVSAPEAREGPSQRGELAMCEGCFANVVQRIDGRWWCAKCGEVVR